MEQDTEAGKWIECIIDTDYEIWSQYPHQIRRKTNKRIVKEWIDKSTGYIRCYLNGKKTYKHRIVAIQFLDNPSHLTQVDHINHIRSDNRLENLRWVSYQQNNMNKSSRKGHRYTFLEQLPPTVELLESYNDHEFNGLFIDYIQQKLYTFNGVLYRELLSSSNNGSVTYLVFDTEHRRCRLYHNKLFTTMEEED